MRSRHATSFGQGLAAGFGASLAGLALLVVFTGDNGPVVEAAVEWTARNLGLAAAAFAAVAVAWLRSLLRLRDALEQGGAADAVAHYDLLTDVWVALFFGVGVIWTAIGMRAALLEAIGPGSAGGDGAAMLARLVDGGILLSLSTTIVGGIGGYLMRVIRALWLGPGLRRFYVAESRRDMGALRASLSAIELRLDKVIRALGPGDGPAPRPGTRRDGSEAGMEP